MKLQLNKQFVEIYDVEKITIDTVPGRAFTCDLRMLVRSKATQV